MAQRHAVVLSIEGMMCDHCTGSVKQTLNAVPGTVSVSVDLDAGTATIVGDAPGDLLAEAVSAAGYPAIVAGAPVVLRVDGMHCSHCSGHVHKALVAVPWVEDASVDLEACRATVHGAAAPGDLVAAIVAAGFTAEVISPTGTSPAAAASAAPLRRAAAEVIHEDT